MKLLLVIVPAVLLICLAPLSAEAKTYENEKYTFEYPNGCKLEKKENRFSTANANMECKGDAAFQFESGSDFSDSLLYSSDDGLIDDMLSALEVNYDNVQEVERGADKYIINNQTAPYIIATYDQGFTNFLGLPAEPRPYVMMMIMIKISDDEKILGEYINDEDGFDKQLPMAEKIFQSVDGLGNGTTVTETETDNSFTSRGNDLPKTSALCDTVTTQSGKDLCEGLLN